MALGGRKKRSRTKVASQLSGALFSSSPLPPRNVRNIASSHSPDNTVDLLDGVLDLVIGLGRRKPELKDQSIHLVDDEGDGELLLESVSDDVRGVGHGLL